MTTSAPPPPTSSALPPGTTPNPNNTTPSTTTSNTTSHPAPQPPRKPLLRLELRDLSSPGARAFLRLVHASSALEDAVTSVLYWLYTGLSQHCIPSTRSVTLVLRSMDGVAYTTGLDIDDDHKEIHLSTDYINGVSESRQKEEIMGVLVHEMVHCWQHNGFGSCPGGLVEGIADWVRLRANYAPPHWEREAHGNWDGGYQHTGYFLQWLEEEYGEGTVRQVNDSLRGQKYEEHEFWDKLFGRDVKDLWEEYGKWLDGDKGKEKEESTKEKETSGKCGGNDEEQDRNEDHGSESAEDARLKARRGGNMHVPVRPGTQ